MAAHLFELAGGQLGLDFVNTVGGMRAEQPKEYLRGYEDLLAFGVQTGSVSAGQAEKIADEARHRPAEAEAALAEAKEIREALHRVFLRRVDGHAPDPADLGLLGGALGRALAHRRLAAADEGCCALGWDGTAALDAPWWPALAAAADLLASRDDLARVRVCGMSEAGECGWLFVDRTKARRHYAKLKGVTP